MKYIDDIEMSGFIHGAKFENLNVDPTFVESDAGRIYFNIQNKILKLNNGSTYIDLSLPTDFQNLIPTLGVNWITSDYGFNPSPFNALDNVIGLNSNNSLFDVIAQLDDAISNVEGSRLLSLKDVVETTQLEAGNVIYYNGENFTFTSIDSIVQNFGTLKFVGLSDVNISNLTNGDAFFYDSSTNTFKPANPFFTVEDLQSVTNHTIDHTLGVQYCQVTLIDMSTNSVINNAEVTFTDINVISIALASAAPIKVLISAPPVFS